MEPKRATKGPYDGRQAAALRPCIGRWVALSAEDPTRVLEAADDPHELIRLLEKYPVGAVYGMLRVPASAAEAEGAAPL